MGEGLIVSVKSAYQFLLKEMTLCGAAPSLRVRDVTAFPPTCPLRRILKSFLMPVTHPLSPLRLPPGLGKTLQVIALLWTLLKQVCG